MRSRVPTRKPRAAPEPSFTLGRTPHRPNRRKVNSTRVVRVCQVVALRRDVAVCAKRRLPRKAGRRLSPDAGVVRWASVHSAAAWLRFAAGVDIVFERPRRRSVAATCPQLTSSAINTIMLSTSACERMNSEGRRLRVLDELIARSRRLRQEGIANEVIEL
jgi:hypothetical protein